MTLNRTIITLIFFSIIFLIGLLSFNDYGASIDDEHYRQNGLLTYEYLKNTVLNILYSINLISETSASDSSLSIIEFTNPFFEVLLAFLSDMFNFEEISELYFFQSGRWDIKNITGTLIKLPQTNLLKSLNLAYQITTSEIFKNEKVIDLRIDGKIVVE